MTFKFDAIISLYRECECPRCDYFIRIMGHAKRAALLQPKHVLSA